jgi:hypothetical protein
MHFKAECIAVTLFTDFVRFLNVLMTFLTRQRRSTYTLSQQTYFLFLHTNISAG